MRGLALLGLTLWGWALSGQTVAYITAGELKCGVRRTAPTSAQTWCYRGAAVVSNTLYTLDAARPVTVVYTAGSDVVLWVLTLNTDGTAQYEAYAGTVDASMAAAMSVALSARDLTTDPIILEWHVSGQTEAGTEVLRLTARKQGPF